MKKGKVILIIAAIIISGILIGSIYTSKKKEKINQNISIVNPGFETLDESGKPKFWIEDDKGGWSIDTKDPYEGKISMKATKGWSWLSQEISFISGKYYFLRAYVKSDIVIPETQDFQNAFLALECLDKRSKVIARNYGIVNATSSWGLRETGIYAPKGTQRMKVKLAKRKGEGSVRFDNVEVVEKPGFLRIAFLRKIAKDKPFFILYFSLYFTLIVSLVCIIFKS